jgi:hypothetical protein
MNYERGNNMRKTINLTRVNGCYSKELREFCPVIKVALETDTISVDEMRSLVCSIIEPAYINATAKRRFINKLNDCRTKVAIDRLCKDAVIHGMYYHPKPATISV